MQNLIITGDWHLRDDRPRCRPKDEDWMKLQDNSLGYLYSQAEQYRADVCVCGDIFHHANVSSDVINMLLTHMFNAKVNTYILAGQHDMQYHSLSTIHQTSYGVLASIASTGKTQLRYMSEIGRVAHFGYDAFYGGDVDLYFTHVLCVENENKSWYGSIELVSAERLLGNHPHARIMCCGDNHSRFVKRIGDRCVIVPGCLNKQSFIFNGKNVGFYLLRFGDHDKYDVLEINNQWDNAELVEDTYTEKRDISKESVNSFIETLKGVSAESFSLSFLDNLKEAIKSSSLNQDCISFIQKIVEEVKR